MSKKKKCISSSDIWFWSLAGYAAYVTLLYIYRKPACEYAAKLCDQVNKP